MREVFNSTSGEQISILITMESDASRVKAKAKRHYCCICSNYRGKDVNGQPITLHRFPADDALRRSWINRLKSVSTNFSFNLKNDRLCSSHFIGGAYNKENPVLSIFILNGKTRTFKSSKV